MKTKKDTHAVGCVDPALPPPIRAMCVEAVSFLHMYTTVTTKGSDVYDIVKRGQGHGNASLFARWAIAIQGHTSNGKNSDAEPHVSARYLLQKIQLNVFLSSGMKMPE